MKLIKGLIFASLSLFSSFSIADEKCWSFQQNKEKCLSVPEECQWCDLGGMYGDFCAPMGKQNCLASTQIECEYLDELDCDKYSDICTWEQPLEECLNISFEDIKEEEELQSIQTNIQHSTSEYWGKSTSSGPDGGVEACAWAVNNIISNAGYRKVGDNPDYVPSVVQALVSGRGRQIQASQAVAGDLVVACEQQHIGICMEDHCNTIDSNSSSRRCFCWRSGFNFDNYFNCGPATYYRLEN